METHNYTPQPVASEYLGSSSEPNEASQAFGVQAALRLFCGRTVEGPIASYILHTESQQRLSQAALAENELQKAILQAASEHLALVSNTDQLTGVKNRNGLNLAFNKLARDASPNNKRARIVSPEPTYLMHIDVDNFKDVNDSSGHSTGDSVLSTIAELLLLNVRKNGDDTVARRGGDEFVVLVPSMWEIMAMGAADAMRGDIEDKFKDSTGTTISVGVCKVDFSLTLEENVHLADLALYDAKTKRNFVKFYKPSAENFDR